jgi:hypothetical protein
MLSVEHVFCRYALYLCQVLNGMMYDRSAWMDADRSAWIIQTDSRGLLQQSFIVPSVRIYLAQW